MTTKWRTAPARIGQWVVGVVRTRFGLESPLKTDDRHLLEEVIIPHFVALEDFRRILFVGSDWYTTHYTRLFSGKEYWTLDKDPAQRKYGAAHHVTAPLRDVERHFAAAYFDLILCNGVLGWGLDDPGEAEASFGGCYRCLRPGGVFLLGWNDTPDKRPFPLEECRSLGSFAPHVFPPWGASRHLTRNPNRHTFSFFEKPASEPLPPGTRG